MGEYQGGPGLRRIVRKETSKAPFGRVTVHGSGKVAVVNVHTVKPDTFGTRRGAELVPALEKLLRKSVTIDVTPEAHAVHKFIRLSPFKARRVMDEVRGKYVDEALAILQFLPNKAARIVAKLIGSAAANAYEGWGAEPHELRITLLHADGGPTMKRIKPRAMGRAYRILKRTCHLSIAVSAAPPKPFRNRDARVRGRAAVKRA